jgi:hypothetical protein
MTPNRPDFIDSPYFVMEKGNWHLKDGAPRHIVDEFREFMGLKNPTFDHTTAPVVKLFQEVLKGGAGSGNFDHKGVKGQRGGSAPDGGGAPPKAKKKGAGGHGRWLEEEGQRVRYIDKRTGGALSTEECWEIKDSVEEYVTGQYRDVRDEMRKTNPDVGSVAYKVNHDMEKFIHSQEDGFPKPIARGMSISEEQLANMKEGSVLDMQGVSSWTSDKSVAEQYARDTKGLDEDEGINSKGCVIQLDKPVNAASLKALSEFPEENEVILSGTSKLKITSMKTNEEGLVIIKVQEQPGKLSSLKPPTRPKYTVHEGPIPQAELAKRAKFIDKHKMWSKDPAKTDLATKMNDELLNMGYEWEYRGGKGGYYYYPPGMKPKDDVGKSFTGTKGKQHKLIDRWVIDKLKITKPIVKMLRDLISGGG